MCYEIIWLLLHQPFGPHFPLWYYWRVHKHFQAGGESKGLSHERFLSYQEKEKTFPGWEMFKYLSQAWCLSLYVVGSCYLMQGLGMNSFLLRRNCIYVYFIFYFAVRLFKRTKSNTIVLTGLSGSGKTTLFYQVSVTLIGYVSENVFAMKNFIYGIYFIYILIPKSVLVI